MLDTTSNAFRLILPPRKIQREGPGPLMNYMCSWTADPQGPSPKHQKPGLCEKFKLHFLAHGRKSQPWTRF